MSYDEALTNGCFEVQIVGVGRVGSIQHVEETGAV